APVVVVSALGVLAALVLPSAEYTRLRAPFQLLVMAMPVIGTGILALAVWRRRVGAGWMLAGSSAFLATVINDSLHYQRVIESTDLSSLGFAAFAMAYSAALALRMFRSEQDATQRLEQANRALEQRVLERTASLAQAKAAAEGASRAKSEFLAVMSHEIRTPIHGWAGLTELLAQTPLTEQQRGYVRLLRRTADDLGLLLGDILDMARIETGRFKVERLPFDLSRLIEELAELGREQARAHGLAFELSVEPGVPVSALGDPAIVRRIIANFLDNAAKFTERGDIGLEVALAGADTVRFSVSDTGCGIPVDRREELFTAFTQMDTSTHRRHGGSGIGLALCRRLAELAGGAVGVDSTPGVGSTFWCELPLPAAAPASSVARDRHRRALPKGLRVLIADDVALNRLVLRGFLTAAGCVVDEAEDGAQAIDMAAGGRYGLIVLDLRMPGTDGFAAARAIRGGEERMGLARVPMAALSAGAAAEDRRMALDAGFDVFLGKPIERDELLGELALLLPGPENDSEPPPPMPPAGLEHLMPLFVAEMDKDARRLGDIRHGPRAELAEFAHAMRGKAGMFGEEVLYQLLTRLETGAEEASEQEIEEIVGLVIERAGQLKVYDPGIHPVSP
ncbi:MAG: ATP-binding protein, partial [Pseudomonadota bacterium]